MERAELEVVAASRSIRRLRSLLMVTGARAAAGTLVVLALGCGGREPAPDAGERPPAAAAAPVVEARFQCGDLRARVRFEDARAVLDIGDRTVVLPQTRSASGAHYGEGSTVFWNKGREATLTLDGREYACREVRDPWRDAEARGIVFRAVGQEPGWYLEIDGRSAMRLVYDYGDGTLAAAVARTVGPAGTTIYKSTSGPDVVVTIEPRPCGDAMSGQPFPSSVTVTMVPSGSAAGEPRELRGCGRAPGADPQWTASGAALGPVRIGMTLAAAAAVLGAPFEPSTEQGECIYRRHPVVPAGVLFMQIGDRIARIDVRSFSVRTDRGVGVGDSEAFVRDAYGTALVSSPHKYTNDGRYLILAPDPAHRLVFETEGGWVTRYRLGRVPEVEWVEGCS